MRILPLSALVGLLLAGAQGCGMRGDPRPPLRKTPPPIADLSLAQEGDRILVEFTVPSASVDAVPILALEVDILTAGGAGEFSKVARRRTILTRGGERVVESEPAAAVGFPLRVAVLPRAARPSPPTPKVIVPIVPPVAPQKLRAQPQADGVRLRWHGDIPEAPPPPPPAPPARPTPGSPSAPPPSPTAATSRVAGAVPSIVSSPPSPTAPGGTLSPSTAPLPATPPVGPGFRVYRRAPNGRFTPLFLTPRADRQFVDGTASAAAEWCYVVRAVAALDPVRESASSNEVCLVVPASADAGT